MTAFVKFIATGFGFGYLRPFAGTWGTIPGVILCYFIFPLGLPYRLGLLGVTFVLSVWSAGKAEKIFGHDAKKIVMDEIAGMTLTMMFIKDFSDWRYYVIGFVLFRFFDVVKLQPAKAAEKLHSGWGVTMDDIVAGSYACLCLNILTRFIFQL